MSDKSMSEIFGGGLLEYKCRRCGEINSSLHTPNVIHTLICVSSGYDLPKEWFGIPVSKHDIHHCKDGGLGVSDLIGGKIDDEK